MTRGRASYVGGAALAIGVIVAIGAGAVFAQADQVGRMGADAHDLATIERTAAETVTHRASLVVAFAAVGTLGIEAGVSIDAAGEAAQAAGRIVVLVGDLEKQRLQLTTLAIRLQDSTDEVARLLASGDIDQARELVEAETLPDVEVLAESLRIEGSVLSSQIEAERSEAGRLARVASFIVALVVPAVMVAGYRRSARRRLERERLESELRRQRELSETKDHLIAGISHQLRTPITGIYGYADLLSRRNDPELVGEGVDAILSQSGDLRRMVDDILVTARIDASTISYQAAPTQVAEIVDRVVAHYLRLSTAIKVEVEAATFDTDGGRLEHALRNLVSNAVAYGREPISVLGRVHGDRYQIAICDAGPGLTPDRSLDPFAPFAHAPADITTANSLGLGLSVARTLVAGIGGSISYTHVLGLTVFALSLPMGKTFAEMSDDASV